MIALALAFFTALLPVIFWYIIIMRDGRKNLQFFFAFVFFMAMGFAYLWKIYAESIFLDFSIPILGIFFAFVLAGICIEYGKNIIVRFIGRNYFQSLDDVVDLSFATAIGFTFMENIILFYDLFLQPFDYGVPVEILKFVLVQEFFVLPIHLFCSGIFGYYYGLSLFARPEVRKKWGKLFSFITIAKGTILSVIMYGLFYWVKEQDLRITDITKYFGYPNFPFDERLLPIISFFFFSAGTLTLFHLLERRHVMTETLEEREERIEKEKKISEGK